MQTIPFNELRAHLAQVLDAVEAGQEPVVISRRGKAAAVLVSCAQYERLDRPGLPDARHRRLACRAPAGRAGRQRRPVGRGP